MGGSYWVAVGTLVLSDLCSMMLWAVCPKAHMFPSTQGSGHEDFSAAGGIGKPTALLEQCQVPLRGSPAAPAWPMGSSTINNRTEILQLLTHLPFFLPDCRADVNVGCAAVPPWHEWLCNGSYPSCPEDGAF